MSRARWLLVIGGVGVVIGSGGVAAVERSVSEQPKPRAAAAGDLRGQRGNVLPPAVALETVLAQIGASSLISARIGLAPEGDRKSAHAHLPWLYATVRVPDMTARVHPLWETLLIEGAVAELIGNSADLSDDIGGSVVEGELPDGSILRTIGGGRMGVSDRGHVFSSASAAEIASSIRSVLPRYGLTEISLRVLHPLGFAPALVVSSTEPRSAIGRWGDLMNDLFGDPPKYEGQYFELRDGSGSAIVRRGDSWRTSSRVTWAIPEYGPNFGIVTPG